MWYLAVFPPTPCSRQGRDHYPGLAVKTLWWRPCTHLAPSSVSCPFRSHITSQFNQQASSFSLGPFPYILAHRMENISVEYLFTILKLFVKSPLIPAHFYFFPIFFPRYFQIVVLEKTLESPLDCKEIKTVNPKGNKYWICIGRTDPEAEYQILWSPDAELTHWQRPWCWERLKAKGEGGDRGWNG